MPRSEREQLDEMTDSELVAYWNILQMSQRMIQVGDQNDRHRPIVASLLEERSIPHEDGKLIETVRIAV